MLGIKGSLARRNALIYFILFIVGISVTGIVLFSYSSREIMDLTEKRLTHTTEMIRLKMMDYTDHLERDVNQLSNSPLLKRYSNDTIQENLQDLTQEYLSVLASKPNIFQIRLIEVSDRGKEIIRVERKKDAYIETPVELLQFKGDRDYYQEMSRMPLDSLYFSEINLNREHTRISQPVTPTLRMGKKIKAGVLGEVILIVNVDLNSIFSEIEQLLPESYELRVVNKEKHYLIHPNDAAAFTFEYDLPGEFLKEFPEEPYFNEHGEWRNEFETDKAIFSRIEIPYGRENYELQALVSAEKSIIFQSFYSWRNKVLLLILVVAVVFLILAFIYMRKQSNELNRITAQLSSFASSPSPMELPIKRKDEIGELARSFELMSQQISESQQLLEAEREKAEEAYAEKNMFLENMSHEIRNPLQAIIGTTDILEQNNVGSAHQPFLNSLKFNANQLKSLVTDILDYGKIKAGQIIIDPSWSRLDIFCNELVQSLMHLAQRKNIQLKLEFEEELEEKYFHFDSLRLYQILNNLLNNALKFTPEKGTVLLLVSEKDKNHVAFSVKDDGPGMPKKELSRILNRNYTSDYATGAGLGLTIVRELLNLLKSQLQVSSKEGAGSTFSFELNIASRYEAQTQHSTDIKPTNNQWSQQRVLVIEDDLELQNWYQHVLRETKLTIATSPNEIPVMEEPHWNLIITDLNFTNNKVTGQDYLLQLIPLIQEAGKVIIISGNDGRDLMNLHPAVDYLSKPIDRNKLIQLVNQTDQVNRFGRLDFTQIEKDYDQEQKLIRHAIQLLIGEWEKDRQRYKEAILNRNLELYRDVTHKILANVKRLELEKFRQLLDSLEHSMKDASKDVEALYNQLDQALSFYIIEMKHYLEKMSESE